MKYLTSMLLAATFAAACFGFASESPQVRKLREFYAQFDAASRQRDMPRLQKLMADNYSDDPAGNVTKKNQAEWVEKVNKVWETLGSYSKVDTRIDHVAVRKDSMIVRIREFIEASGKTGADGISHKMVFEVVEDNLWVKEGDAWKLKTNTPLSQKMKIDGHLLPPPDKNQVGN